MLTGRATLETVRDSEGLERIRSELKVLQLRAHGQPLAINLNNGRLLPVL